LFDELTDLEEETGVREPDSPTRTTGSGAVESADADARREPHEFPALSLAKSKDVHVLMKWAGERQIWLSWKLDGITLVATYDEGILTKLMTRGNGTTGTVITYLAPYIGGLPERIDQPGHMVVRGEAVISYEDFQRLNDGMEDDGESYANPRNLTAGTLALDHTRASQVRERGVTFRAFTLVYLEQEIVSWGERMDLLKKLGFDVVEHERTDASGLESAIERWTRTVQEGRMPYPVDGLVITYDDTVYASGGSVTGHHATNAGMAFKWQDTAAWTTLVHIEWSCAASTISPVAVFDKVRLEGTTVQRASLCNISEMKRLGIGADRQTSLKVIKANMIIPKCIEADSHGTQFEIPTVCPVCGAPVCIRTGEKTGTQTLHCTNPDCTAKQIQKFTRFVSKTGMDIDGLSVRTIMKFINLGFLADFADIYDIAVHRDEIIEMDGFGEKSYANMIRSVEKSRQADPVRLLYALCIPMIGTDAAKRILSFYGSEEFFRLWEEGADFSQVDGIGPEKASSLTDWIAQDKNRALLKKLLERIEVAVLEPQAGRSGRCLNLTFVITGDVHTFRNRDEFKAYVESQGGKVTGSVSKKTDYLVNNDAGSASSKNRKAKELGIPVLTEEDFNRLFR
ncbi:MAG: NAD-dependent DNA ligase LigA, partial [Blautia sp.]|nr:NAD-dependent DNA ligase LigA [Blautia sp.]